MDIRYYHTAISGTGYFASSVDAFHYPECAGCGLVQRNGDISIKVMV
ncbi:TPA: hypothetical protein JGA48_004266 [Salmonella enterica]|nr:hypothetical protein [Salmonella enterica]